MNVEQFLKDLEQKFNETPFSEIVEMVNYVDDAKLGDEIVNNIIKYVRTNNRISFKQWQNLKINANKINKANINFKYGD